MPLGDNVRALRTLAGLTLEELSERSGVEVGTISALEKRHSTKSQFAADLASALRVSPEVLMADTLPADLPPSGVANSGQYKKDTKPPMITWEAIMQLDTLPPRFIVEMPDDALSPSVPRGMELVFECAAQPRPGYGVLVLDRHGRRYIRRYAEGLGGAWAAQATNPAFLTLQSERDGLVLIATMTGRNSGLV